MKKEEEIFNMCSKKIIELSEIINELGGRAFIVGGFLRDIFLQRESKDIDIEIIGLKFSEVFNILEKLGKTKIVGTTFPVILYENIEISIIESIFNGEESIKNAAIRRDFTINSLYFDIIDKKIYDFFNGIVDINSKVIRSVNEKNIEEDPLRILRAVQFAARFEFTIDSNTKKEIDNSLEHIYSIPKERIFIELEKILLKSNKPSIAFNILRKMGWLNRVFPEVDVLKNIEQGKKYHPEGDVFIHTMLALDFLPIKEREIDVMLSILFHDIGKAIVENIPDGDNIHFYGHDKAGAAIVKTVLLRITDNCNIIGTVEKLIENHMYPLQMQKGITKKSIKKIASKLDFEKLMKVHRADMGGKGILYNSDYIDRAVSIYKEIKDEIKPLISGKELIALGVEPGILIGEYLKKIYEAQLDEQFLTYNEGVEYAKKIIGR